MTNPFRHRSNLLSPAEIAVLESVVMRHCECWKVAIGFALVLVCLAESVGQSSPIHAGTTYYVDSKTGNDSNAGISSTRPWKTLAKVNSVTFAPGDTILFKSGSIWTGQLWPKGSGKQLQPITIDRYGGEIKPVIRGAGQAEDAVLLKNQEYWEIRNLEITNTGKGNATRRGVHVTVQNYGDAHHIYLRSLTVHDVNGTDSVKENGGIIYSCDGETKPSRFVDLRIEDNRVYRVDRSGIFGESSHWERSKWYPSLGVVIRNNVLEDIGGDGIVNVATDGALVEYNVVGHANQRSAGNNVAIWAWSADNTIIQHNEAFATRGRHDSEGFDSDWNSHNTIIQYNYSHDNEGGFLLICNEGGWDTKSNSGNTGTIVRYNISQNDHHKVISIAGPTTDSYIYNNTIYVGKAEDVDLFLYSDWKGWADGTHFFNNIFYVEGSGRYSHVVPGTEDGPYTPAPGFGLSKNNTFDANVYFGIRPLDDPHALSNEPLLIAPGKVSPGNHDLSGYGLRPDSPAVNSGKALTREDAKDFFGTAVPSCGRVDRGAVEMSICGNPQ